MHLFGGGLWRPNSIRNGGCEPALKIVGDKGRPSRAPPALLFGAVRSLLPGREGS
jgi:hypothetical protein